MPDRLEISITGELPDAGKFAILAAAEAATAEFVKTFNETHKTALIGTAKPVRPGKMGPREKKVGDPAPPAAAAPEPATEATATIGTPAEHPATPRTARHHAAE